MSNSINSSSTRLDYITYINSLNKFELDSAGLNVLGSIVKYSKLDRK